MSRLPGIDDVTLARAGLTDKQLTAVSLYSPGSRGHRSIALAMDCSPETARDHLRAGLRKLEVALRAPAASPAPAPRKRQPVGIQPFA